MKDGTASVLPRRAERLITLRRYDSAVSGGKGLTFAPKIIFERFGGVGYVAFLASEPLVYGKQVQRSVSLAW